MIEASTKITKEIVNNLARVFKSKCLTSSDLEKNTNICERTCRLYMNSKHIHSKMTLKTFIRIINFLDVSPSKIIKVKSLDTNNIEIRSLKTIGERVKYLREKYKLSQVQLSIRTNLSNTGVSAIENGEGDPYKMYMDTIVSICRALNVSLDAMLDNYII